MKRTRCVRYEDPESNIFLKTSKTNEVGTIVNPEFPAKTSKDRNSSLKSGLSVVILYRYGSLSLTEFSGNPAHPSLLSLFAERRVFALSN